MGVKTDYLGLDSTDKTAIALETSGKSRVPITTRATLD